MLRTSYLHYHYHGEQSTLYVLHWSAFHSQCYQLMNTAQCTFSHELYGENGMNSIRNIRLHDNNLNHVCSVLFSQTLNAMQTTVRRFSLFLLLPFCRFFENIFT